MAEYPFEVAISSTFAGLFSRIKLLRKRPVSGGMFQKSLRVFSSFVRRVLICGFMICSIEKKGGCLKEDLV